MFRLFVNLIVLFCTHTPCRAAEGISLVEEYKKNSNQQWEWALTSLANFPFTEQDKVLDVGCRDGRITALIANQVQSGSVVGLDISEKMIEQASNAFQEGNLKFIKGNANDIPFKEEFDKVVSFCTLQWIVEQEKALISMKESFKVGGGMLLVIPGESSSNLGTLAKKIASTEKWRGYFPHFKMERVYYSPKAYKNLLQVIGLDIQALRAEESVTIYENKEAFIAWLKPLVNFVDHLAPDLQQSFIEELADQMIQKDLFFTGSVAIPDVKIEIIARRLY
ncbi:Methyltransferase [Candidatus Protochlamydia naegleriophila]|uniref:Methyltransferase n=1 Tax=Candidatus Protochlamydia naegleriophila TaxID=389348 RepID=A0A0U5JDN8_9BACT|nr:class I SAM-dependent methyltransferase [Candidatus Protochlamydia naegleriophila]CUI16511.1 Methyltransferase [Candidatus Protochlamydia naegleriophila]